MRPLRTSLNKESLIMMGIPRRFCDKTMKDFNTYGKKSLKDVKEFVQEYIDDLPKNIEENRGICFMGSNGVGKSYLSCIIMKEAYRHRYSCRRVTFSSYISAYTESWGASKDERDVLENDLLDKYKGVEFLVLEEIGKEIDSKIAKPILEDLLRFREEHGLTTIICTNLTPQSLKEIYGASIVSLINGNMTVIIIDGEDKRGDVFDGSI
jgi:DNA replication protein DnaC